MVFPVHFRYGAYQKPWPQKPIWIKGSGPHPQAEEGFRYFWYAWARICVRAYPSAVYKGMHYQFALCELEIYQLDDGSRLIVPQLTTKTRIITRTLYETAQAGSLQTDPEESVTQPESVRARSTKPRYRDIEEWASNTKLKHVSPEDMIAFANDMEDLGFTMNPGTADFGIDLRLNATGRP